MKQFVVAAVLVTFASISHAQTVVSDTNLSITLDNSFPPSDYRGTIWQDAAKSNPTSIWFNYDGLKITFGTTNVDEGSDWYLVHSGDVFSKANVEAHMFPIITEAFGSSDSPVTVGSSDFWLGIATGNTIGPHARTVFGWAHITPVLRQLTMSGNAISYNSLGIVVGTTTTVPEPTALCLLGIISSAIAVRRHRK